MRNLHVKTGPDPDQFALRAAGDLATMIARVRSTRQAQGWTEPALAINEALAGFLRQRSEGALEGGKRPWHHTHRKARSAWRTMRRHTRTGDVFTWLDPDLQAACDRPIPATTNDAEGGINAPLKDLLRHHRGLPKDRQRILADQYLALRTENPPHPAEFLLHPRPNQPRHAHKATDSSV